VLPLLSNKARPPGEPGVNKTGARSEGRLIYPPHPCVVCVLEGGGHCVQEPWAWRGLGFQMQNHTLCWRFASLLFVFVCLFRRFIISPPGMTNGHHVRRQGLARGFVL
jgi:hypothetical protein